MSDSLRPHGLYSLWNSPGRNNGFGSHSLLQGNLPNPRIKPRSPTLQTYSLPAEPPGKPSLFSRTKVALKYRIFCLLSKLQWLHISTEKILHSPMVFTLPTISSIVSHMHIFMQGIPQDHSPNST